MKHAPIVVLALAAALVAGCGGGSSVTEEEHSELEQRLEAERLARDKAEREAREAAAREAAERRRAEAAEGQLQGEQEARQEAEERADDLEEEAGHTANQLVQANARQVYTGLNAFLADTTPDDNTGGIVGSGDPTVTPRYRESASVTTAPAVTFSSITTGTSGNWFRTSFSNRAFDFTDRLDVYSDAETPDYVSFRDSVYNDGVDANEVPNTSGIAVDVLYGGPGTAPTEVVDGEGDVVGSLDIMSDTVSSVVSSPFPRSGDGTKSFRLVDRGQYTTQQRNVENPNHPDYDSAVDEIPDDYTGGYRNGDRYPLRYTYEASGSLAGASGTFTCATGDHQTTTTPAADTCGVTNQNGHFLFVGPWVFTPSASARVRVDDAEFMYFGWWARQDNETGDWMFRTFHGPMGENRSTAAEIAQLSGTAIYKGPAVGQYSFYEPLGSNSEYGEFTAKATLRANFTDVGDGGDETVHGTIDQFDGHPDWTLTLKERAIDSNGVIPPGTTDDAQDAVSWQIEDEALAAPDSGTWEAAFYSNLPADKRGTDNTEDATPTGIAGTFEAEYHHVGSIIGAFGAHKQQ